jgi:hypothetical protein
MDRSQFDLVADQLRAYAKELEATIGDSIAQATNLLKDTAGGAGRTGLAGTSPDESGASLALSRISERIEHVMGLYDQIQESIGGAPRYKRLLEELSGTP